MNISELIQKLQTKWKLYGDLPVYGYMEGSVKEFKIEEVLFWGKGQPEVCPNCKDLPTRIELAGE